ncbi:MAG: hypothetical protein RLN63_03355 [Miltoncostaeaceae bacterium]
MSIVSTRLALVQRCTIQRDAATVEPAWGQPGAPDWQDHAADVPCRAVTDAGREPVDEGRTATFVTRRVLVPLGTDVTEADRVSAVTERGQVVMDGPMGIEAVLARSTHLELMVERIR